MVFHGFGRIRVVSERSKSYPRAFFVKGGASKSHPEGQSASGELFQRVKITSGGSKSCLGGSFRRVKMVSGRVESVPVKVQIASGGPKLRPESASGASKSHPEAESRAREGPSEGQNGIREGRKRTREGPNRIRRAKITSGLQTAKPLVFPWFSYGFSRFGPFSEGRGRLRKVKVVSSRAQVVSSRLEVVSSRVQIVSSRARAFEGP